MSNVIPIGKAKNGGPKIPDGHVTEPTTICCPHCEQVFWHIIQHSGPLGDSGKFEVICGFCGELEMEIEGELITIKGEVEDDED